MSFGQGFNMEDLMELRQDKRLADEKTASMLVDQLIEARRAMEDQYTKIHQLEQIAAVDEMTGLANRKTFEKELSRSLAIAKRYNRIHSMMVVSVDNLAVIQANMGRDVGDEVLVAVSNIIKRNIRTTDVAARLDVDKFGIILNEIRRDEDGVNRAAQMTDIICSSPCVVTGRSITISANVGCYVFGANDEMGSVLHKADVDLHRKRDMNS